MDAELHDLARRLLDKEVGALSPEEARVLTRIARKAPISRDTGQDAAESAGFWDRLADRVAKVGGSWSFIFSFGAVLLVWMLLNSEVLNHLGMAFDPYPFIFLNLMLSTVAAPQAPVIMMSQNRQGVKDREAAAHDYEVNLRAELEIMALHEKLDAMRARQERVLLEQQTEVLELIRAELGRAAMREPGRS